MNFVMTLQGGFSSVMVLVLTVVSALTLRKPRKISVLGTLLSGVISALSLIVIVFLGGMRLNLLLAVPALLLGMLLGFVRGQMVKFSMLGKQVIGRNSILFIILWGASLGISLLLGLLNSPLLASLGLVPVFFSTGLQLGYYANLFLRRTAILLGAASGGFATLLNLGPDPRAQGTPPSPPQGRPKIKKKKNVWVVVVVILIVGACLLITAFALVSMLLLLMI